MDEEYHGGVRQRLGVEYYFHCKGPQVLCSLHHVISSFHFTVSNVVGEARGSHETMHRKQGSNVVALNQTVIIYRRRLYAGSSTPSLRYLRL